MEALTCPKCGAPLQANLNACPYCRVGLTGGTSRAIEPHSEPEPAPAVELPPGWTLFQDRWLGFSIARPPGWEVSTFNGQTTVRGDPVGFTSVAIAPFSSPTPTTAQGVALQFVNLGRQVMQNFQAWQQGNVSPDSNRISLRTRATRFGQVIEGIYNILVEGQNCIISGYNAPPETLAQIGHLMAKILTSFRTTGQQLPRQTVREPMEDAFVMQIPSGWIFRAGVNRNNIGGAGTLQFSAGRDPQSSVMVSMPTYTWAFIEPMMSLFSFPGGYPSLGYLPASKFVPKVVMEQVRKLHRDVQLVSVIERPDLAELNQWDLARSGYPLGTFETSVAMLDIIYSENGVRYREKSRVGVMRQPGQAMWSAIIDMVYRAPERELESWEPVLTGSFNSLKVNPQWQAGERGLAQNYINNAQADIRRRQAQISQTLSETSDIVANSYWNRQATYDRISEMQSNTTLDLQNVASTDGDVYKVPNGYDRYWVDGLGTVYGGSWLTQPDLNWKPLEPTGI
jgi:hypothetical protein